MEEETSPRKAKGTGIGGGMSEIRGQRAGTGVMDRVAGSRGQRTGQGTSSPQFKELQVL